MKQQLRRAIRKADPKNIYWWLAGICAVYIVLVLGNMTRWSIWFDEAFSAYLMRFNLAEISHFTALDVHPPFYYWLLKGWTMIAGVGEVGLRSFSLLWGVVAIVGVFVLIRRLYSSPQLALWAAGATAFSPLIIRYGDEARMYTMVLAIVVWATYVLVRAMAAKPGLNRWWIGYGLLLAVGMLTHYYVALAWLAHWAWRALEKRAGRIKQFWSREWIWSHALAIALFVWWLPTAIRQFLDVQTAFWIPPLGAYTPVDYLSNMLLYQQYGGAKGWSALVFVVTVMLAGVVIYKGYPLLKKQQSSGTTLLLSLATVPPLILTVASMPPMTSTFMDRYVIFAQAALMIIAVIAAVTLYRKHKPSRRLVRWFFAALALSLAIGIANVYYYGNYNKNSNTSIRVKEVMRSIESTAGGIKQPVIAETPWIYYESVVYASDDHPVYFLDSSTDYKWGSLAMLKERDDNKIIDIHEFTREHRYVWYIGSRTDAVLDAPVESWRAVQSVEAYDNIDNNSKYRATLFDTQPSVE